RIGGAGGVGRGQNVPGGRSVPERGWLRPSQSITWGWLGKCIVRPERSMRHPLQLTFSVLLASACAFAGSLSNDFKGTNPDTPINVLVRFDVPPTAATLAQLNAKGAKIKKLFKHMTKL